MERRDDMWDAVRKDASRSRMVAVIVGGVVIALAVLGVVSFLRVHSSPARSAPSDPAPGTGQAPTPETTDLRACHGASECVIPHPDADVDGDGRADQVSVVLDGCETNELFQACLQHIEVHTVTGVVSRIDPAPCAGSPLTSSGDGYLGAGDLDGRPGAELAYIQCGGPHSEWGWLLTWRNDRLERVRRNGREFNFIIDGAATVEIRLACRSEPSGHVLVESGISTDSFDGRTWSGEEITMAFDPEGDLSDVGKTPLHFDVGDQRPPIIGGFDCPGFQLR